MVLGLPVVLGASRLAGDRRDASSARNQIQRRRLPEFGRFRIERIVIRAPASSFDFDQDQRLWIQLYICCRERRGHRFHTF